MSLTSEQVEQRLDAATEALREAREHIEQARTHARESALDLLDKADRCINDAESIIDLLHYAITRQHGPNHMALEFGRAGLALLQAREGVEQMRAEARNRGGSATS